MRGRECLLDRDYAAHPISYSFKVRNQPEISGTIDSQESFYEAVDLAFRTYQTDDISTALRRIGKGICPRSFPTSSQSLYFLDMYYLTHGGESGLDLVHLPNEGGILDQPSLFFRACEIISHQKALKTRKRLKEIEDQSKSEISGQVRNSESGFRS